jgi:hypothetical protein
MAETWEVTVISYHPLPYLGRPTLRYLAVAVTCSVLKPVHIANSSTRSPRNQFPDSTSTSIHLPTHNTISIVSATALYTPCTLQMKRWNLPLLPMAPLPYAPKLQTVHLTGRKSLLTELLLILADHHSKIPAGEPHLLSFRILLRVVGCRSGFNLPTVATPAENVPAGFNHHRRSL